MTKRINFREVPSHLEIERRYLLTEAPSMTHPVLAMARPITIVQTYLRPVPGFRGFSRVRETRVAGVTKYYWAAKQKLSELTKTESEVEINRSTYEWLLNYSSADRTPVTKTRRCFKLHGLVFELDHVRGDSEHWLLEVELEREDQEVTLPVFLPIAREVTFESLAV